AERDGCGGALWLPSAQEEDHSEERESIHGKGGRRPGKCDHQSAERWADGARDVESHRVERDAGGETRRTDNVRRDGLPGGIVDDGAESAKKWECEEKRGA